MLLSRRAACATVALFCTLCASAQAQPQLLAEWRLDPNPNFLWGFATVTDRLDWVGVHFGPTAGFDTGPGLFETVVITTGDIGRSFPATPANDPHFGTVAALLTNGATDDTVFVITGLRSFGAAGARRPESYWASHNGAPADFSGATLTSIEMYVNNAFFQSPGTNPNGNGVWTDFRIDRRLRIYGVIPEPGAGAIVVCGGALVALRRRVSR